MKGIENKQKQRQVKYFLKRKKVKGLIEVYIFLTAHTPHSLSDHSSLSLPALSLFPHSVLQRHQCWEHAPFAHLHHLRLSTKPMNPMVYNLKILK